MKDAERWKQVDDLLQSTLLLPSSQRDGFLRTACAGDVELEREVRSLLGSHEKVGGFLTQPAINVVAQAIAQIGVREQDDGILGQTISHYRILEKVGSGGMGVVYQAEDLKLGRRVAMKFLPGEVASDRVAFERLQREARAASALDHPNICSIHELDEHAGHPFIVMPLLEGQTLRSWIEAASKKDLRSRLGEILNLATQIANGLHAAHEKGIIHRDIKPANIFITSRGEAKILDFGLAKVLEEHAPEVLSGTAMADKPAAVDRARINLTLTGATMGTASYMSPEQVRGDKLDARSDLFSLGLVLYEMVTGQKAFAGDSGRAIQDAILCRAPTPPRELNRTIPSSLERIVNRATEKDRCRRYESAREIAGDLERLRSRTITVAWWLGRKWTAAAVVLAALILTVGALVERSRHRALPDAASAGEARRSVAVLRFRNLSNRSEEDWISTALAEMFSTELAAGQQLRIIPGERVANMQLDLGLDRAGSYGPSVLRKIQENLGADVIVQGSYLSTPGGTLRIDWQLQEGSAQETISAMSESGSEAQITDLVSRAGAALREKLRIATIPPGELDKTRSAIPADPQAARLYSEGLAKMRAFDALGARDVLVKAITVEPKHALSHSLLAESLFALGYDAQARAEAKQAFELSNPLPRENQLLIEGRYNELSNDFPAAIESYRSLWKFFPDDLDYGLRLAAAQTKASLSKDALLVIAQMRKLPEPVRNDPRIDLAESRVADSLGDFTRTQEAAGAAAKKSRLQGKRQLLAEARHKEAWALDRLGDFDKSIAADTESRNLAQEAGNLRAAATAANGMGTALYDKGDLEGARNAYEDALGKARQVGAQRVISAVTSNIGNVFYDQGKSAEARQYYVEALKIDRQLDDKRGIASNLGNLANVLQGLGDLIGALKAQQEALQAFRDVGDRRGEAVTLSNLGNVLIDRGELVSAKQKYQQALSLIQEIGFQRGRIFVALGLATILEAQDHLPEARASTLEGLALSQKLKDDSDRAQSQWQLAHITLEQGDAPEAERLARSAFEEFIREKSVANACSSMALLARTLLAQGKPREAQTAISSALHLCQRGQVKWARFQAEIANAAIAFETGKTTTALRMLDALESETTRSGFVSYELETRLYLGEVEIKSGKVASGRSRLEALQKDAQYKSFGLIGRKARLELERAHTP